jgi:hypothetical protein
MWNLNDRDLIKQIRNSDLHHELTRLHVAAINKSRLGVGREQTHTLFDSVIHSHGVLCLVDEQHRQIIFQQYSRAWSDDLFPLYFNELSATDPALPRPFAIDLDFHFEGHIPPFNFRSCFDEMFACCQKRIKEQVAPTLAVPRLFVGSGGLTHMTKGEEKVTKLGFHLVWSELNITQPQTLAVRRCIIDALVSRYGEIPTFTASCEGGGSITLTSHEKWNAIFDANPLSRNPQCLRMFGSRKIQRRSPHTDGGDPKKQCMCEGIKRNRYGVVEGGICMCFGGKIRDAGRQLLLAGVYEGETMRDDITEFYRSNNYDLISQTSLRPDGRVLVPLAIADDYLAAMFLQRFGEGSDGLQLDKSKKKAKAPPASEDARALIIRYLKVRWPEYISQDGKEVKITYSSREHKYEIAFESKRCDNCANGYHTSKHSYMWIQQYPPALEHPSLSVPGVVSVHCWSDKEDPHNRLFHSSCKNYVQPDKISNVLRKALFPSIKKRIERSDSDVHVTDLCNKQVFLNGADAMEEDDAKAKSKRNQKKRKRSNRAMQDGDEDDDGDERRQRSCSMVDDDAMEDNEV